MSRYKFANESDDLINQLVSIDEAISSLSPKSNTSAIPVEIKELFEGIDMPVDIELTDKQEDFLESFPTSGYQSPIKGDWKNSGDYSPDVATDKRHPKGHSGVDMRAPEGTPIYPMAPGVVLKTDSTPIGGNSLTIEHADNVKTYYAHCADVKVQKGQKVNYDTVIATVGMTGNAQGTWPHLHFQVWENNQLENPSKFFSVPRYSKLEKGEQRYYSPKKNAQTIDEIIKIAEYYDKLSSF